MLYNNNITNILFIFMVFYFINVLLLIMFIDYKTNFIFYYNKKNLFIISVILFSLSGIPPFFGFFIKINMLGLVYKNTNFFFFILFIICNIITMLIFINYFRILKTNNNYKVIKKIYNHKKLIKNNSFYITVVILFNFFGFFWFFFII